MLCASAKCLRSYQLGLVEECARILLVVAEHHGGGGEGGGGLGGDLRPGRLLVDLVQRPRRLHVLRTHPALVVQVGVTDLHAADGSIGPRRHTHIDLMIMSNSRQRSKPRRIIYSHLHPQLLLPRGALEQVVGAPPEGLVHVVHLLGRLQLGLERQRRPRERRHREGEREPVLDVVAGVVVSTGEIHLQDRPQTVISAMAGYRCIGIVSVSIRICIHDETLIFLGGV